MALRFTPMPIGSKLLGPASLRMRILSARVSAKPQRTGSAAAPAIAPSRKSRRRIDLSPKSADARPVFQNWRRLVCFLVDEAPPLPLPACGEREGGHEG